MSHLAYIMDWARDHPIGAAVALGVSAWVVKKHVDYYWPCKCCCKKQETSDNVYEGDRMLAEYLTLHYAPASVVQPYSFGPQGATDFPLRCAELCVKHQPKGKRARALDIGCAVGRSSFELARSFDSVLGMDLSASFINCANDLKANGSRDFHLTDCFELTTPCEARIDQDIDRSKTSFAVADACQLNLSALGQFDLVLAANLICRLPDPRKFLSDAGALVASGGHLVIMSPFTFMTEYTPRDKLVAGYMRDGKRFEGIDGLHECLDGAFTLVHTEDMPFFIRETARKNQWTVSQATVWKRK